MYRGTNPTALKSMQWISDALLRLMEQESYDLITIKQICLESDLTRKTFYNCFDSKDEVLSWQLARYLEDYLLPKPDGPEHSLAVMASFYRRAFLRNKRFFTLLIREADHILKKEIASRLRSSMSYVAPDFSGADYAYYVAYLSGGLSSLLIHWLSDETPLSEKKLIAVQKRILSGQYYRSSAMLGKKPAKPRPSEENSTNGLTP